MTNKLVYDISLSIIFQGVRMSEFLKALKNRVLVFDGAMGTMIQRFNLTKDDFGGFDCNDYLSVIKPEVIKDIHKQYLEAGAQVIETNTFNASFFSLKEYRLEDKLDIINRSAVRNAKEVCLAYTSPDNPRFVSGSVGPGTKLPSLGHLTLQEVIDSYYPQIYALVSEGVDVLQIETNQDPLHIKGVLNACYKVFDILKTRIPIIVQATIQENGQMLVGTDPMTFAHTFSTMPIEVIGINCGTGPHYMENNIKTLSEHTDKYLSLLPNAGLPIVKDGVLTYDLSPDEFASITANLVKKYNINMVGGCCGTNPDFIRALALAVKNIKPQINHKKYENHLTSMYASQSVDVEPKPLLIGERANTNGSKKFKTLLEEEKWDEMLEICRSQQEEGAHVLDICLAHLNRDEVTDMQKFIPMLNLSIQTPLMIDSTSAKTVDAALRLISGKPIINSTNFEEGDAKVIEYLTIARNLNSALICLAIDETGMAKDFEHKKQILKRFIKLAEELNVSRQNLFFDCLTFSLATGEDSYRKAGIESIKMINYIENDLKDINSIMGVSNVSFGLKPKVRKYLNAVFLAECVKNGLDAAIVDSSKLIPINEIEPDILKACLDLIYDRKTNTYDPLLVLAEANADKKETVDNTIILSPEMTMENKIVKGSLTELDVVINQLLEKYDALAIINEILIKSMQKVGAFFESGKLQLPFVLKSAEVMKKSVDFLKPYMTERDTKESKSMLLATVKGDVHDIGKNLVQIILENNGYKIIDIGVKQTPQQIKEAILLHNPQALGLSALLIKSTYYMKETLEYLKQANISIPVICGGAALNQEFVEKELQPIYDGKVSFGKDAFSGLEFMKTI